MLICVIDLRSLSHLHRVAQNLKKINLGTIAITMMLSTAATANRTPDCAVKPRSSVWIDRSMRLVIAAFAFGPWNSPGKSPCAGAAVLGKRAYTFYICIYTCFMAYGYGDIMSSQKVYLNCIDYSSKFGIQLHRIISLTKGINSNILVIMHFF